MNSSTTCVTGLSGVTVCASMICEAASSSTSSGTSFSEPTAMRFTISRLANSLPPRLTSASTPVAPPMAVSAVVIDPASSEDPVAARRASSSDLPCSLSAEKVEGNCAPVVCAPARRDAAVRPPPVSRLPAMIGAMPVPRRATPPAVVAPVAERSPSNFWTSPRVSAAFDTSVALAASFGSWVAKAATPMP